MESWTLTTHLYRPEAHPSNLRSMSSTIASYIAGIIPSATPELSTPPFNTTLNELQNDLANAVTDAAKAVDSDSFEVRQNYNMLRLVAELTGPSGPWNNIDAVGLQGSMDEGFALWAYKQLLPTVLERDIITGCASGASGNAEWDCSWSAFNGAIGSPPNFTTLNAAHTTDQDAYHAYPCGANWDGLFNCTYNEPPTGEVNGQPGSDIATKVWGQLSDTCNFNGQPQTEWTFDCNLGISPALSTDPVGGPANGWTSQPARQARCCWSSRGPCRRISVHARVRHRPARPWVLTAV